MEIGRIYIQPKIKRQKAINNKKVNNKYQKVWIPLGSFPFYHLEPRYINETFLKNSLQFVINDAEMNMFESMTLLEVLTA